MFNRHILIEFKQAAKTAGIFQQRLIEGTGKNLRQIINKTLSGIGHQLFNVFTRKYIKN